MHGKITLVAHSFDDTLPGFYSLYMHTLQLQDLAPLPQNVSESISSSNTYVFLYHIKAARCFARLLGDRFRSLLAQLTRF